MADQSATTALAIRNDQATLELAAKCRMMLPYGNLLLDNEAIALAAYSKMYGLDPFYGESYFLVRVKQDGSRESKGVYAGVKGLRKKAKEQLREQSGDSAATYTVDYVEVDPKEIHLDPRTVACAVKATLRDENASGRYIMRFADLKKIGMDPQDIYELLGRPPMWVGYGAVRTVEMNYIKMLPIELAKKRAECAATKLRFDLGWMSMAEDTGEVVDTDAASATVSETPVTDLINSKREKIREGIKGQSEKQILNYLGFDVQGPAGKEEPAAIDGEVHEEGGEDLPDISDGLAAFWPEDAKISYNSVAALLSSDQIPYIELSNEELSQRSVGLNQALSRNHLTDDQKEDKLYRLDAIRLILQARDLALQNVEA